MFNCCPSTDMICLHDLHKESPVLLPKDYPPWLSYVGLHFAIEAEEEQQETL